MLTVEINNRRFNAKPGEMILPVLRRAGITIPTLCQWDGLAPSGHCRLCVVEVDSRDCLVPACSTPIADGMRIRTHTAKVLDAREVILDLLLSGHPSDCIHCSANGKCELQSLSGRFGADNRLFKSPENKFVVDDSSLSIVRDPSHCILCGRCIRICSEQQTVSAVDFIGHHSGMVVGPAYNAGMSSSDCVNCGQCISACPTAALKSVSSIDSVTRAINDPGKHVVAMVSPSVSVTIAEEFGFRAGTDMSGLLNAALYNIGFSRVFDNAFAADINVLEHSALLARNIRLGNHEPLIRVCSSAAGKFLEHNFPALTRFVSSAKPVQQMLGALAKSYYAEKFNINPENIFTVSITPCSAKKIGLTTPAEDLRINQNAFCPDVDAVLTTQEVVRLIGMRGIDINTLVPETPAQPFAERSTAGKLFGVSGGISEAIARTTYQLLTGAGLEQMEIQSLRGFDGRKEARFDFHDGSFGVVAVSGLNNARVLLNEIVSGRNDIDFIEISACPSGCISGGGQPKPYKPESVRTRMKSLYSIDRTETIRVSHKNRAVSKLYDDFLGSPLSPMSLKYLHINPKTEVL